MKKLLTIILSIVLALTVLTVSAEENYNVYSIEDAFADFKLEHPDFVKSFVDYGVVEDLLMSFLQDTHTYILEINSHTPVTYENFEKTALTAISGISSREKYYIIQDALLILYPDAIRTALKYGTVDESLKPVVETVKRIVFENKMIYETDIEDIPTEPAFTFTDLPDSHWAYNAVNVLAENFIINGYLDGSFKPEANITRGEFAKIIVSATDTLDTAATSSFSDVSEEDWYYLYVSSAYKEGFITGYPDGTFHPNDYITRADICTIVSRSLGSPTTVSGTLFSDDNLIPSYAKIPVYALVRKGIINGMGDGRFSPTSNATRAQTAQIIYSAFFN